MYINLMTQEYNVCLVDTSDGVASSHPVAKPWLYYPLKKSILIRLIRKIRVPILSSRNTYHT